MVIGAQQRKKHAKKKKRKSKDEVRNKLVSDWQKVKFSRKKKFSPRVDNAANCEDAILKEK